MALDLEAIRRRVQELSGVRKNSAVQLWKPTIGEYKIRGLPWKQSVDGMPFQEKFFYYIGNNPGFLAPSYMGKPDPINDLIRKLYSSGKPEDRLLAKKLQPKMRAYMPIIVRGQEDKGVQVWSFGKIVYQRLLGFFTDEDVGDILDSQEGYDLKVNISQQPGKQFQDTAVDPARKPTKLSDDAEQQKKWLDEVPNLDDMYRLKSVSEIETILNNWLSGGQDSSSSDGTQKGQAQNQDELDKLVSEVKSDAKPEKTSKAKQKKVTSDDEPIEKKSLDDAFNELIEEE